MDRLELVVAVLCCPASLAYLAFGIMYMVWDAHVCGAGSPLEVFCYISLVVSVVGSTLRSFYPKGELNGLIQAAVTFALLFYGVVIIYYPGYVCQNMKRTGLYVWALVTFYLLLANVIVFLFTCLYEYCGWSFTEIHEPFLKGERVEARHHEADVWMNAEILRHRGDDTYDIIYENEDRDTHVPAKLIRRIVLNKTEESALLGEDKTKNENFGYTSLASLADA